MDPSVAFVIGVLFGLLVGGFAAGMLMYATVHQAVHVVLDHLEVDEVQTPTEPDS